MEVLRRPMYELMLWGYSVDLVPLIRTGWAGVDVFFVLSGFVLGLPYCQALPGNRPPIRTGEFFRRRFLRVLPAYYVQAVILLLLWIVLVGHLTVPDAPFLNLVLWALVPVRLHLPSHISRWEGLFWDCVIERHGHE